MTKEKNKILEAAVIGLKLLLICAVIAGVVSCVYALTLDTYEKNLEATKNVAIGRIFGKEGLACQEMSEGSGVYTVQENGQLIGYCVESSGKGFGGDIQLMVGYTLDQRIISVEIISLSETPGVGDKVNKADYLAGYREQSGQLALGSDIDKIAGSTVSSKGVLDGVNAATLALNEALKGGSDGE